MTDRARADVSWSAKNRSEDRFHFTAIGNHHGDFDVRCCMPLKRRAVPYVAHREQSSGGDRQGTVPTPFQELPIRLVMEVEASSPGQAACLGRTAP